MVNGTHLLNSGFPVNLDKSYLDSYEFELTRALMIAGILQASRTSPDAKGFLTLDENMQKEIINKFSENYLRQKKSLILSKKEELTMEDIVLEMSKN